MKNPAPISKKEAKIQQANRALMLAAEGGTIEEIVRALNDGAQVETWGFMTGDMLNKTTELNLGNSIIINPKNKKTGWTALMRASTYGHPAAVELLLESGANINQADQYGYTALMYAAAAGHEETVRLLLDRGAQIIASATPPLILAAKNGHAAVVARLLDHKPTDSEHNINTIHITDDMLGTALIRAAHFGHTETVKLLLDNGAKVNTATRHGMTALMLAVNRQHKETAKLLLENGATVNAVDSEGMTALMWVVNLGRQEMAKLLLDNGATVNAVDNKGMTALMWAAKNNNTTIINMLLGKITPKIAKIEYMNQADVDG